MFRKSRLLLWAKLGSYTCDNCRRNSTLNEVDCFKIVEGDPSIIYWGNEKRNMICPEYETYSGDKYPLPKEDDSD